MRTFSGVSRAVVVAAALVLAAVIGGCATHRYYDPEYRDYHRWDRTEIVFYNRWEVDTRRPHVDFFQRNDDEKRAYWHWRHDHKS